MQTRNTKRIGTRFFLFLS